MQTMHMLSVINAEYNYKRQQAHDVKKLRLNVDATGNEWNIHC